MRIPRMQSTSLLIETVHLHFKILKIFKGGISFRKVNNKFFKCYHENEYYIKN